MRRYTDGSKTYKALTGELVVPALLGFFFFTSCAPSIISPHAATATVSTNTQAKVSSNPITSPSQLLQGSFGYDISGTKISGTMINRGSLDASLPYPGSGYYSGNILNPPLSSQISAGTSVLGVSGTGGSFVSLSPSTAMRALGTTQITLSQEFGVSSLPTGYREIPDINLDDSGEWPVAAGCTGAGGATQTCSTTVVYATRPTVECGTPATMAADGIAGKSDPLKINERIAHCADAGRNGANATWDGGVKGNAGQGIWKLVTRTATAKEVWRDERTQLIWSDTLPALGYFCQLAGNHEAADPSGRCNNASYQDQVNPVSACAEAVDVIPAIAGENWGAGTYDDSKGNMGLVATANNPTVRWRLPTKYDVMEADINGLRFVHPTILAHWYWLAGVLAVNRTQGYFYDGSADISIQFTQFQSSGFCVGRWK